MMYLQTVGRRAACLLLGCSAMVFSQGGPAFGQSATPGGTGGGLTQGEAQQLNSAEAAGGAVMGRVLCADTQRPARFAEVTVLPVEEASGNAGGGRDVGGGRRGSARTDLDGNFVVSNLPAGAYYVNASATGYISTLGAILARASSSADVSTLLAQLPQVQVSGSGGSTANLSLERGGVIAGKLQWDDGSAAAGVQVNAVLAAQQNPLATRRNGNPLAALGFAPGGNGGFNQTDDRGSFRITGLPPGDYLLRATFSAPVPLAGSAGGNGDPRLSGNRTVSVNLYAPGKMRRTDAQTLTLRLGEERTDVQFIADLHALHSVSGHVSSASDAGVHSGSVRLVDSQDTTLSRNAQVNADGSFMLPYVPAGTYTLSVPYASSATLGSGGRGPGRGGNAGGSSTAATTFQPLQETLTVIDGDIGGVNLTLVPSTSATTTASR